MMKPWRLDARNFYDFSDPIVKFWKFGQLRNRTYELIKIHILFAMWNRREYFIGRIGWDEDEDFIGINFVISVQCIQIANVMFTEK